MKVLSLLALVLLGCTKADPPAPVVEPTPAPAPPPPAQPEPTASEALQPFVDWVVQAKAAPMKAFTADQMHCEDDPKEPSFGECRGVVIIPPRIRREAFWYRRKPAAFRFQSEQLLLTKNPECVDLGAVPIRSWQTNSSVCHRCKLEAGPLAGLELFIRTNEEFGTLVRVTSPQYLRLDAYWANILENEGKAAHPE